MANTVAKIVAVDESGREKKVTRLGGAFSQVEANTWHTFCTALVYADGSGYVSVVRDDKVIHEYRFGTEAGPDKVERGTI